MWRLIKSNTIPPGEYRFTQLEPVKRKFERTPNLKGLCAGVSSWRTKNNLSRADLQNSTEDVEAYMCAALKYDPKWCECDGPPDQNPMVPVFPSKLRSFPQVPVIKTKRQRKVVAPKLIGRFGNQMFIYAHARALAEQKGYDFQCPPWLGDEIFNLSDSRPGGRPDIVVDGYCQNQESLIYTKRDCQRWFQFRQAAFIDPPKNVAHIRRGDYLSLGYVVVSQKSYVNAAKQFAESIDTFLSDDFGRRWQDDCWLMAHANVLFRGNSSFSWWAATLGNGIVYSPVIEGKQGGKEQDCEFVVGNHPRFAELPNITDLHLAP